MNNKPTYYKNPESSACIDLIVTNCARMFQCSSIIETELSDLHKMVLLIIKTNFRKLKPKIVSYRKYRFFLNECFREDLIKVLSNNKASNDNDDFGKSFSIWREVLNNYALRKGTYLRGTTIRLTFFLYNYGSTHRHILN